MMELRGLLKDSKRLVREREKGGRNLETLLQVDKRLMIESNFERGRIMNCLEK